MSGQLDLSTKTIKIYKSAFDAFARSSILAHIADLDNPHDVDKADVGLGNADNTSDANKPISTAAAAALALKAPLASPALTGTPTAPTAATGTVTTQLATTAFVQAAANVVTAATAVALALKADIASPALTGTPTSTTASPGDNSTRIATTAFVAAADALKANIASPTLTGVPLAPTAAPGTNTTQIATTAFTRAADDIIAAAAAAAQADADQALIEALPVPSLVAALRSDRPGEAARLYGETKTGAPSAVTVIDQTWVTTSAAGSVVRVDGAAVGADDPQTIAPVGVIAMEANRVYQVRWKVQRQTDPLDPLNDSVTLGIRWLQNTKAGVVSGGETTIENIALVVADGIQERIVTVALTGRTGVDYNAPAGTIYFRPFVDLYGGNGVTDVIVIDVERVTVATMFEVGQRTGVDGADSAFLARRVIDDSLGAGAGASAHGFVDESIFSRTGGAAYASFDVKITQIGDTAHNVGFQYRPRFEGVNATVESYVHGFDTNLIADEATHHINLMAHFSAGSDSAYAGSIDFEAGFISGNFSKANEGWAFYGIQERSRFRGVTSFFGSTTAAIALTAQTWASTNFGQITFTTASAHGLSDGDRFTISGSTPSGYNGLFVARSGTTGSTIIARRVTNPGASSVLGQVDPSNDYAWNWFGDEDTGFYRRAANQFTIVAGGTNSFNVMPTETWVEAGAGSGPVRFYSLNANNNTLAISSIGSRSSASITSEAALITTPALFDAQDWLFRGGAALRTNTGLPGGLSVAVLAGDFRLYTSGSLLDMHIAPAYAVNVLTAQTWSGGQITFTTTTAHQLFPGNRVVVSGSTPSGYNGSYTALPGTTGSTIIVTKGANPGASSVLGSVEARKRFVNFTQSIEIGSLPSTGADATILLRRELNAASDVGTGHGITIADDFSRDTFSYAAFDDDSNMSGTGTRGHHRAFQARPEMIGNFTMTFKDSFHSDLIGVSTVSIANVYHFRAGGDANFDGSITSGQYGLRIDDMTKGGANIWGIWVNSNACRFAAGTIIDASGRIQGVAGALGAGLLSYWFGASDTDTGFYRPAAGNIGFACDGVERLRVGANGLTFLPPVLISSLATNGQVAFEFTSDTEFKIVARGTDGTLRKSASIPLS